MTRQRVIFQEARDRLSNFHDSHLTRVALSPTGNPTFILHRPLSFTCLDKIRILRG